MLYVTYILVLKIGFWVLEERLKPPRMVPFQRFEGSKELFEWCSEPSQGDEDSEFARTATPDEDIFQRTWTPLAAGCLAAISRP